MSDFSRTNTESQLILNNYSEQSPSSPSKFSMIGGGTSSSNKGERLVFPPTEKGGPGG